MDNRYHHAYKNEAHNDLTFCNFAITLNDNEYLNLTLSSHLGIYFIIQYDASLIVPLLFNCYVIVLFHLLLPTCHLLVIVYIYSVQYDVCCCFRMMTGVTGNGCVSCVVSCSMRTSILALVSCAVSVWIATWLWSIL